MSKGESITFTRFKTVVRPLKLFFKVGLYSCNSKKNEKLKYCVYFQISDGPSVGSQNNN